MLVLSRRQGEKIVIGNGIEITVLGVRSGGNVSLGISAPQTTTIWRKELLDEARPEPTQKIGDLAYERC